MTLYKKEGSRSLRPLYIKDARTEWVKTQNIKYKAICANQWLGLVFFFNFPTGAKK